MSKADLVLGRDLTLSLLRLELRQLRGGVLLAL